MTLDSVLNGKSEFLKASEKWNRDSAFRNNCLIRNVEATCIRWKIGVRGPVMIR